MFLNEENTVYTVKELVGNFAEFSKSHFTDYNPTNDNILSDSSNFVHQNEKPIITMNEIVYMLLKFL